jgi:transposase InsO family protein
MAEIGQHGGHPALRSHGQCISGTYQKFLGGNALVCSMSAVGHCADNAACEGFFGQLKRERVNHRKYRTRDEARADLFDYPSSGSTTRACVVE